MKIKKYLLSFLDSLFGGFLGAFAGADNTSKNWRRFCIPGLIVSNAYNYTQNLWVLTIGIMILVLSLGYSVPDETSRGSVLGRFWNKICFKIPVFLTKRYFFCNLFTRGTISIVLMLTLLILPIIKGNWILYKNLSLLFIFVYSTISWRNLGNFIIFYKTLIWSEFIVYSILVGIAMILIYF